MKFEPWMLAALDDAGYNGIREKHINKIVSNFDKSEPVTIDSRRFQDACHKSNVALENFTQEDIKRLQDELNDYLLRERK